MWLLIAWLALAVPAVTLTLLHWSRSQLLPVVLLQALTPFAIPLYVALLLLSAGLTLTGDWLLPTLGAALAVTGLTLHLRWLAPLFRRPRLSAAGTAVTVMTANLLTGKGDAAALVRAVREREADLLVAQEVTPAALAALEEAGVGDVLPHRAGAASGDDHAHGTIVFARHPFSDVTRLPTRAGSWAVTVAGLRVHADHPAYPFHQELWRSEHAALVEVAAEDRPDLLLGDFNASLDHAPVRRLLALGYRDAAEQAGSGWQPTWPAKGPVPAWVAIDHVFVGPRLAATATEVVTIPETDHRALLARLVVRPRPPADGSGSWRRVVPPYPGGDMTDRTVYLDHAATTPMVPAAVEAMTAHLLEVGNASSLHASGRRARRVVEESRETIAQALDCRPGEVVFTSGGTEADNLALKGVYWSRRAADPRRVRILTTAVEHHAVLDPLHWLAERDGAEVELLPVDGQGRLDPDTLREAVERDPETVALVSVMWANNEVGTLQPVPEVVAIAAEHGIPVHTDAVQAVGAVPVGFAATGVDALTLTGHKVGGPYGVGALVARRELSIEALVHGGGQERDIRSGTIDTPAIAGFAAAVELAVKQQPEYAARVGALRDRLVRGVLAAVPDAVLNGADPDPVGEHRLPGNAHFGFPGCEGDSLLMLLDARGIECSTGSACSAGVPQPSHVLLAMGQSDRAARSSLRFSLGHTTTEADVDALVEAIGPCVERATLAGGHR